VADLDSDGYLDVVATAPTGKSFNVRWLRNSNLETTWTTELVGQQEGGGNYIALGDLDGDGRIDVTAASVSASLVQWFRNPGPAALAPGAAQVPWSVYNIGSLTSGTINQVQLADLDGDAPPECLVISSGSGIGFRVNGDPRHSWEQFLIFDSEPPAEVGRLAFSDFDGDGKIDFVAPFDREGLLDDQFVLYKSIAASLWQRRLVGQQQDGADAIALGDIDEDGNIDVAAASENLEVIQWFRNPGPTSLLPTAPQVPWDVFNIGELSDVSVNGEDGSGRINQVRLVDMEGDGHLECYVTANQSNDTDGVAFLFKRQADVADVWSGSPMFTTDPAGEIGPSGFLDVDGNGLIDVIAPINRAGLNKDQIIIFER